jgi:hypothetical protein
VSAQTLERDERDKRRLKEFEKMIAEFFGTICKEMGK